MYSSRRRAGQRVVVRFHRMELETPHPEVVDLDGIEVPAVVEDAGHTLTWLARDVPSLGWRAYRVVNDDVASAQWKPLYGNEIANDHYRLVVDPARGGGVS